MNIATWNINSIRLRMSSILKFIKDEKIDVICLQETKVKDDLFPLEEFNKLGFSYSHFRGEKSYNGVATLSKLPIKKKYHLNWCGLEDTRHIVTTLNNNITIHNFYVPAGGDVPDVKENIKFKHKINFLKEMIDVFSKDKNKKKILLGDLNIAPLENDVWSHKQLLNVVSHTKKEIDLFKELILKGKWVDAVRLKILENEKVYSWWSYRNKDWKKSDRGRRLDHILVSKDLINIILEIKVYKEIRGIEKPSDHVPIGIKVKL
jgi:exodeoxyribonuclease-3